MSAVKNQEIGQQGSTITLDVYFHEFDGGALVDPDTQVANYEIFDPSGSSQETGTGTRLGQGRYQAQFDIPAAATVSDQWKIQWSVVIGGQGVIDYEYFRVVAAGSIQFNEEEYRKGKSFANEDRTSSYHAPNWGYIITPDELRYMVGFGTKLVSPDASQTYDDNMLQYYIDAAIGVFANDLRIDIFPHVITHQAPRDAVTGLRGERTDLPADYITFINSLTDEQADLRIIEKGYPYRQPPAKKNYMYMRLRNRPVRSVDKVVMVDPVQQTLVDLLPYTQEELGMGGTLQFTFSQLSNIPVFLGMLSPFQYPFRDYPNAFLIDYKTGYENSRNVPKDLVEVIRMLAGIMLLNDFGDGKSPGLASASVNLNSISESFGTTQSASIGPRDEVDLMNPRGGFLSVPIGILYKRVKDKLIDPTNYKVRAVNPLNVLDIQWKPLLDVVEHVVPEKFCYEISTPDAHITVTEDHSLFYVDRFGLTQKRGDEFFVGESIACVTRAGVVTNDRVVKVEPVKVPGGKVYDLSVADFQNFIVNNRIIAHNTNALYGARIGEWLKTIAIWWKRNKYKYGVQFIGVL